MANVDFAHQQALARLLASRLERLSADSHWARRASGLRGALLKALAAIESGGAPPEGFSVLLERGFEMLEKAAREIAT